MSDLLIAVRAVHFASTLLVAGTIVFDVLVAMPALRGAHAEPHFKTWRRQSARIAWLGLATAVLSGVAWLLVLAADISSRPLRDVLVDDIGWSVLTHTRFGTVWSARLVVALLLAGGLIALARCRVPAPRWLNAVLVTLAALLLGSLAWSGHAAGTPRIIGDVHIAADALHVVAAGAWIGGLVPLALLFAASRRAADPAGMSVAREATSRFSTLGMIAVSSIVATGLVNTYVLVGSVPALIATDYGRLLVMKISLFVAMVGIAAFNRLRLTPRLVAVRTGADAQRQLQRNSLVEAAMGLLILAIVGALGTLPPGLHALPSSHMHGS